MNLIKEIISVNSLFNGADVNTPLKSEYVHVGEFRNVLAVIKTGELTKGKAVDIKFYQASDKQGKDAQLIKGEYHFESYETKAYMLNHEILINQMDNNIDKNFVCVEISSDKQGLSVSGALILGNGKHI